MGHRMADGSLFERLGGEAAVQAAVVGFYEKVMADPTLAPFFAHMDMDAQIDKQIAFMTVAFGGPNRYGGRELAAAHARPVREGLTDAHFDRTASHLQAQLQELQVPAEVIGEVMHIVGSTRGAVLGRRA